jgi:hypothetical protein
MTKEQLIEKSLQAMRQAPGLLVSSEPEDQSTDEYDAIVIPTTNERVPDCAFKTCGDLALEVECCENCHTFIRTTTCTSKRRAVCRFNEHEVS